MKKKEKSRLRLLLAEDERILSRTVTAFLNISGFDVVACEDGREAQKAIARDFFHALITDLELPDIHGYELIRLFAQKNPAGRVIVISAHPESDLRGKAHNNLSIKHLQKPFALESLRNLL